MWEFWVGTCKIYPHPMQAAKLWPLFSLGWIGQNHSLTLGGRIKDGNCLCHGSGLAACAQGFPGFPENTLEGRTRARMLCPPGSRYYHPLGRAWLEIWVKVHPTTLGGLGQGPLFLRLVIFSHEPGYSSELICCFFREVGPTVFLYLCLLSLNYPYIIKWRSQKQLGYHVFLPLDISSTISFIRFLLTMK